MISTVCRCMSEFTRCLKLPDFTLANHDLITLVCTICQIFELEMRFPTMWNMRPAKAQISLRIRAV